jgi:hypothetical protein
VDGESSKLVWRFLKKIKGRRKRYENYLPILGAFGIATIYSLIRQFEHPLIKGMVILTFFLTLFRYVFVFKIHGIDKKKKYFPSVNKKFLLLLTGGLIVSLELINYLLA